MGVVVAIGVKLFRMLRGLGDSTDGVAKNIAAALGDDSKLRGDGRQHTGRFATAVRQELQPIRDAVDDLARGQREQGKTIGELVQGHRELGDMISSLAQETDRVASRVAMQSARHHVSKASETLTEGRVGT